MENAEQSYRIVNDNFVEVNRVGEGFENRTFMFVDGNLVDVTPREEGTSSVVGVASDHHETLEPGNLADEGGFSYRDSPVQWSRDQTLQLLDCYKSTKSKIGKHFVTKKKLWILVAEEYGKEITASQCENRWKVLERNFKSFMDNKIKTGRGRKHFEFAAEMEAILGKKKESTSDPPPQQRKRRNSYEFMSQ